MSSHMTAELESDDAQLDANLAETAANLAKIEVLLSKICPGFELSEFGEALDHDGRELNTSGELTSACYEAGFSFVGDDEPWRLCVRAFATKTDGDGKPLTNLAGAPDYEADPVWVRSFAAVDKPLQVAALHAIPCLLTDMRNTLMMEAKATLDVVAAIFEFAANDGLDTGGIPIPDTAQVPGDMAPTASESVERLGRPKPPSFAVGDIVAVGLDKRLNGGAFGTYAGEVHGEIVEVANRFAIVGLGDFLRDSADHRFEGLLGVEMSDVTIVRRHDEIGTGDEQRLAS